MDNNANRKVNMNIKTGIYRLAGTLALAALIQSAVAENTAAPPRHPYLADSDYPMLHASTAATPVSSQPGPVDISRRLDQKEIQWKPIGFGNGWEFNYSGPYPDGRRAIWIGGSDLLVKLDARTLETLSSLEINKNPHGSDEVIQAINHVDSRIPEARTNPEEVQKILDYLADIVVPILRTTASGAFYRFVSNDNEQYLMTRNPVSGDIYIDVYGDSIPGDITSAIELKRRWVMPREEGIYAAGMAMSITYDGRVILVTSDGRVFAVSRDLKEQDMVALPGNDAKGSGGYMGAFVRNGIAVDDEGGIYVVTQKHMHRVQWTGEKLSLDPEHGAWSTVYKNGERGSGTTPTLMGWGDGKDKLVVITDGEEKVSVNFYWRDNIPADWKGLDGHPRRLAGTIPLSFGENGPENFEVEGSPMVYGYGVFFPNDTSATPPPRQGAPDRDIFAKYHSIVADEYIIRGGVRYNWIPGSRRVAQAWMTPLELAPSICTHAANDLVYCFGRRKNEYSMEALSWQTGEPVFHYLLGESYRFNNHGGVVRISPYGDIDSPSMASGMIRLRPTLEKAVTVSDHE
jgi:hypothetical protein